MIQVAIVGLGMAAEPHAKSLLDLAGRVSVRWAASPSHDRTRRFAANYPFPVTNDVAAAIADPAVDAVLILTPPDTHRALATAAFEAGKHVLLEKPLATTIADAIAIVEAAARADRRLGVVLQHRFRPGSIKLRDLLADGSTLGRVEAAVLTIPWWRPQSYYDAPGRGTLARDGGGVLMTQAIHSLDLFRALLGPIEITAAMTTTTSLHRMETEDFAAALGRLGGGQPASILATTAYYPGSEERIEIIAANGVARLIGGTLTLDPVEGERLIVGESSGGSGADPMAFSHDAHRALIEDFLDAVAAARAPIASGTEALASQYLIEAILGASRNAA
jgi:predicted dehydrogenase